MKKIMKKNQLIVTTLAIMIAVAGYLTFSSDIKNKHSGNAETADSSTVGTDVEIQDPGTDVVWNEEDIDVLGEDESSDIGENGTPGEAVLTESSAVIASAKISKGQVRAQTEESLNAIINNANLNEAEKQAAVDKLVEIAGNSEMEVAAETLLQAKGFSNVMVSITDGSVDVVVYADDLNDTQLAQIADIVKRKTGVTNDKIVITPVGASQDVNPSD